MAEPMTDERLADLRAEIDREGGGEPEHATELLAEVDRLRAEMASLRDEAEWLRDEEGKRNAELTRALRAKAGE